MTERIIDVNGEKYRVQWDEHGYLAIEAGIMRQGQGDEQERFYPYHKGPNSNRVQFDPAGAEQLKEVIEAEL